MNWLIGAGEGAIASAKPYIPPCRTPSLTHKLRELMLVPPYCLQMMQAHSVAASSRIQAASVNCDGVRLDQPGTSTRSSSPSRRKPCPIVPAPKVAPPTSCPAFMLCVRSSAPPSPGHQPATPRGSCRHGCCAPTVLNAVARIPASAIERMIFIWCLPGAGVTTIAHLAMRKTEAETVIDSREGPGAERRSRHPVTPGGDCVMRADVSRN